MVLTGRVDFTTAAVVWSDTAGAGAIPEGATDTATGDIDVAEALAAAEESMAPATSAAFESEPLCVMAIETIAAEVEAGNTETSMETGLMLLECLNALEDAEDAAARAEELAADINEAAPGSQEPRAAADLPFRQKTPLTRRILPSRTSHRSWGYHRPRSGSTTHLPTLTELVDSFGTMRATVSTHGGS